MDGHYEFRTKHHPGRVQRLSGLALNSQSGFKPKVLVNLNACGVNGANGSDERPIAYTEYAIVGVEVEKLQARKNESTRFLSRTGVRTTKLPD